MARLPNVTELVGLIQEKVAQSEAAVLEKKAQEEAPPPYNVAAAQHLLKLAGSLRKAAAAPLTYSDIREFMDSMGGRNGQ